MKWRDFLLSIPVGYAAGFLFMFALSSLVPAILIMFAPGFEMTVAFFTTLLGVMAAITASVVLLSWQQQSVPKALTALGLYVLWSGLLGLVFTWISPDTLFGWAQRMYEGFAIVEPVLDEYWAKTLPKVKLLIYFYLLLGSVLVWLGLHYQE